MPLTDIIRKANQWTVKQTPNVAMSILPVLEKLIDGEVITDNDEFFIQKHDGRRISFAIESEGIKKIGLLWRLLMNENITENSIFRKNSRKVLPAMVTGSGRTGTVIVKCRNHK